MGWLDIALVTLVLLGWLTGSIWLSLVISQKSRPATKADIERFGDDVEGNP